MYVNCQWHHHQRTVSPTVFCVFKPPGMLLTSICVCFLPARLTLKWIAFRQQLAFWWERSTFPYVFMHRKDGEVFANIAARQIAPAVEAGACQHIGCWLLALWPSLPRKEKCGKKKNYSCPVIGSIELIFLPSCHCIISSIKSWSSLQCRRSHGVSFTIRGNLWFYTREDPRVWNPQRGGPAALRSAVNPG